MTSTATIPIQYKTKIRKSKWGGTVSILSSIKDMMDLNKSKAEVDSITQLCICWLAFTTTFDRKLVSIIYTSWNFEYDPKLVRLAQFKYVRQLVYGVHGLKVSAGLQQDGTMNWLRLREYDGRGRRKTNPI